MKGWTSGAAATAILATALVLPAHAGFLRFDFEGQVTNSDYPADLPTGTAVSGHVAYDPASVTSVNNCCQPATEYSLATSGIEVQIDIGSFSFSIGPYASDPYVYLINIVSGDRLDIGAEGLISTPPKSNWSPTDFLVSLIGSSGFLLTSGNGLPELLSDVDVMKITSGGGSIELDDEQNLRVIFDIIPSSVSAAFIPEPATLALFGLGLAGIGAMRRKKLAA